MLPSKLIQYPITLIRYASILCVHPPTCTLQQRRQRSNWPRVRPRPPPGPLTAPTAT